MNLIELIELVNAKIVAGNPDHRIIEKAFCSDLMSDVLTIDTDQLLLITGMANVQTIRTAEMADIHAILLVRNKKASPDMIKLAKENNLVLFETSISMFHAAGKLYTAGLKPVY
ncbi:MAG: hypothetical protein JXR22_10505 [Prolixibacteraceae bacterium]|nr:hypothetical protein [Prolixibacteraceae bacterium]